MIMNNLTVPKQNIEVIQSLGFRSPSGRELSAREVAAEIISFMKEDENRSYKVTIGTDSLLHRDKNADFITAIVVHRVGNGGRYFWKREKVGNFHTLRDRIYQEVLFSLDVSKEVLEYLKTDDAPRFSFEIHVDVGDNGDTKTLIQEMTGMIRAMNYEVATKPFSYAASSIADKHV